MTQYAKEFNDLITRLQIVLSEIDYAQKACLQAGKMECVLLKHLYNAKEPLKMNELSKILNVSHSRVTRIMDNLVNKQLVLRAPSATDRRCWFAKITEKGIKLAENSQRTVLDQQVSLINKLPADELENVYKSLRLFVEKYEELMKENYIEV